MFWKTLQNLLLVTIVTIVTSCGNRSSEDSGGGGSTFSGNMQNVSGTITSQSGTPSQMKSWIVALLERDSGVGRIAEVDSSGILKWNKLSLDAVQTAVLLSPDFLVQSVTAIPSTKSKTVKQFFQVTSQTLPQLVQKGAGISFQNFNGLVVADNYATDTDGDGNPDGVGSLSLVPQQRLNLNATDTDKDGTLNDTDLDIDGDGLINSIDDDDDGDGTADLLDSDANGNGVSDSQESIGDAYFSQGIEYFAVRYEKGASSNSLQFVVKIREGLTATSVKIKSASSLFEGATTIANDGTSGSWDSTLGNDGANFDGAASDLLFGRKVKLGAGISPRVHQMIFAQVTFGTGESAFTIDYPWTFSSLAPSAITTSYNTSTREVTLSGNPFGADIQSFVWSISVTNSSGLKVYESSSVSGATRTVTIPANVLVSGSTYSYEAIAQTLDKIPGVPAIAVRSAAGTINNP